MECLFFLDLSFVILLLLPLSDLGKFTVMGPEQPIITLLGKEITLPCHLSPQLDARYMEVLWFHDQSSRLVYHYKYGEDYIKDQHQDYQGRTEFLQENISNGSVALRIYDISLSDEGKYRCHFESANYGNEKEIQVSVAVMGSTPQLYITGDGNKRIGLVCTSAGWYPEPEVQWRYHHKKSLPGDTVIKKTKNGLFFVETSITVFANSKETISCFISNSLLGQKMEASVALADDLFPNVTWMVTWIVTMILVSTVFPIFIFRYWKLKKVKDELNDEVGKLQHGISRLKGQLGLTEFIMNHRVNITWDEDSDPDFFLQWNDEIVLKSCQERPRGHLSSLLGKEILSSGSYYWEINVERKTKWALGCCVHLYYEYKVRVIPENGFWILCQKDNSYQALSNPPTTLQLSVPPKIVGLFLDCEDGQISFYNVTDHTHIYTFNNIFIRFLHPFNYSESLENRENSALL